LERELNNYLRLGDEKVEIMYVEGEREFAQESFDTLGNALSIVTSYFSIAEPFPKIRAVLVRNRNEFDRLVRDLLHVEIEFPSNPARIAQPQRTDMVVLSPSAYENHSIFKYIPDQFRRLLFHEMVHMVEEHLSPNIEASPRWWGEGLAVYLSGQWLNDDEFRKPALDGIAQNDIPGFHQVEAERRLAYDWGWTIVRFIESAYGKEMILRIVKECPDGNVFSVIGEEAGCLEKRWRDWLFGEGFLTITPANETRAGEARPPHPQPP
jgi:hypothetical protein